MNPKHHTVNEYIKGFPVETQTKLEAIRNIIKRHAPDAIEAIAYGVPAYKMNQKPLVYFAGYEKHIGFYATPQGHEAFKTQLSIYKQGKGSVQFPLNQALPDSLIAKGGF